MARTIHLEIGGRRFAVSCEPDEEERVRSLGELIDSKAREAGAVGQSEPRMLLFAALLLADELRDGGGGAPPPPPPPPQIDEEALAERVDAITRRIENIASHLEGDAAGP